MNARFPAVGLDQVKPSRKEDLRLITGQGCFTADVHYPGELHLHVIRSMYPHGRIRQIDLQAVRQAPGVVAVFTADDVQAWGLQAIPNAFAATGMGGAAQQVNRMPVLAQDRVLFVGQPIAMVLAESALAAQDAGLHVLGYTTQALGAYNASSPAKRELYAAQVLRRMTPVALAP